MEITKLKVTIQSNLNFLYAVLVSIDLLDISFEKNIRMESHHLAEQETKNVFDQLEYIAIRYMLGAVLSMEGTEMNHRNPAPQGAQSLVGKET